MIKIERINSVFIKVHCDRGTAQEINEEFRFKVPGAEFMPAYKNGYWNGYINLFSLKNNFIYAGLRDKVVEFLESRDYQVELISDFSTQEFSIYEAKEFIESLNLPIKPRDYQLEAFITAIREGTTTFLSPTASGKSFIIYLIAKYLGLKTLVIVPTINLVKQMSDDFKSYGYQEEVHQITSGVSKATEHNFTISTWQSLISLVKAKDGGDYFNSFGLIIVDECHQAAAKVLQGLIEKATEVKYKFGFTGTLDGSLTHELVIAGLLGPIKRVATTKELMDQGHVANLKIKAILLSYTEEEKKLVSKMKYQDEVNYIVTLDRRNRFIKNLALSLENNTLVLFNFVEKHGVPLYERIKEAAKERNVYYVSGITGKDEREYIRGICEKEKNAIIVASAGVFATGINIPNLHNIILTSPSKARVRLLQSIGRSLRLHETKDFATLYDIADDFSWKSKRNYSLEHFKERIKIYSSEEFDYKIYNTFLKVGAKDV